MELGNLHMETATARTGTGVLSRVVAWGAGLALALTVLSAMPGPVAAAGMSGLHVSGNQLVNAQGQQVILHGVNRAGSEYACIQGWGFFDGDNTMSDDAVIAAMKPWGITAVNVGLNEDCWLGINGVPAAYGGTNYQNAIIHDVQTIEANGMYPILSLFWDAPGSKQATDQSPMPDADHSPAFWQSVATTFKNDPAVLFRLKEEPYPANNSDTAAAWKCWRDGGSACTEGYSVAGMQTLITTIRNTGAQNVIQVPGIQYANSLTQFLSYKPSDPLSNLMAVVDVYPASNLCGTTSCYNSYYAPVIQQMPFIVGEFGESADDSVCGVTASNTLMNWLDQHASGYLAWTWDTWGTSCADLSLITDYSGTPKSPNGTNYKSHLATLASAPAPSPAPAVSLSPTSLTFASQQTGTSSSAQAVTVSNSGNAALAISSIGVTGTNASDFTQTNTCPTGSSTLAAGAKCTISVTFTPAASGTRTASVAIADNASGSPQQVSLSGTGSSSTTTAPSAPSNLSAGRSGGPNKQSINLSWADNSTNEANFVIERSKDNFATVETSFTVSANTTNYADTSNLARQSTYAYRVKAVSSTGVASAYSNVASVTTK